MICSEDSLVNSGQLSRPLDVKVATRLRASHLDGLVRKFQYAELSTQSDPTG